MFELMRGPTKGYGVLMRPINNPLNLHHRQVTYSVNRPPRRGPRITPICPTIVPSRQFSIRLGCAHAGYILGGHNVRPIIVPWYTTEVSFD